MNLVTRLLLYDNKAEAITGPPAKVSGVFPANLATNLQLDTAITWLRSAMAQWYDVWIGPNAGALVKDEDSPQTQRSFNPTLALDSTYYFRIDSGNSEGTTTGDVTSFSTWASVAILLDENDNPITDENGEYIETE